MEKITYTTHYFHLFSRGADEVCVMNTATALAEQGKQVTLIIPNFGNAIAKNEYGKIYQYYGVKINFQLILKPAKKLYSFGVIGRFVYKASAFITAIAQKSDVYIVRQIEIAVLFGVFKKNVIFSHHEIVRLVKSKLMPLLLKIYDDPKRNLSMLCITNNGIKKLISEGFNQSKIFLAPMGVNLEKYQAGSSQRNLQQDLSLSKLNKIVGFSGSMYPGRGTDILVESAKYHPDLTFVFIGGKDEEQQRLRALADNLGVGNVFMLGFIKQNELPSYLMGLDILVMPYNVGTPHIEDMSSMKMFEYMAVGKPIISSDFPVMREVLAHEKNAILVAPDSPEAISKAIAWVLENPQMANQLGVEAKKLAEEYTWGKRVARIIDYCER